MEILIGGVIVAYKERDKYDWTLEYFYTIRCADAKYRELADRGFDVVWTRLDVNAKGQIQGG